MFHSDFNDCKWAFFKKKKKSKNTGVQMKSNFIKLMKGSVPETSELTFKADSCLYLASRS